MEKKKPDIIPRSVKIPQDVDTLLTKYLNLIDESFSQYVIGLIKTDIDKNYKIKMEQKTAEFTRELSAIKKKKA